MSVLTHLQETADDLTLAESEREYLGRALAQVKERLSSHFGRDVITRQFCFGSWSRRTALPRKVDERSDIDYMIVFDNRARVKPQALIERLVGFAEEHYPRSDTYRSRPTVVLNLRRYRVELVPAYAHWLHGLQIPARTTDYRDWLSTDPISFEKELNRKDAAFGRHVRPVIRLLKFWNLENEYVYDSYYLEQFVAEHAFPWGVASNLQARLFSIIERLPTAALSAAKRERVAEAREIVGRVEFLEAHDFQEYAEVEVSRLIPVLK